MPKTIANATVDQFLHHAHVVLTAGEGPDLLLDLEAFAPALPVRPSLDLAPIASAVSAAATLC